MDEMPKARLWSRLRVKGRKLFALIYSRLFVIPRPSHPKGILLVWLGSQWTRPQLRCYL